MGEGIREPSHPADPAVCHNVVHAWFTRPWSAPEARQQPPNTHSGKWRTTAMRLAPSLRQLALTAHVTTSVGWLGAVIAYLGLAIAALSTESGQVVRSSYLAMELIISFIILPLSFASLLTGLVSSLGTTWGLFRHYWVVFKLVLNVLANTILLMYMQSITHYAGIAANTTLADADLLALRDPTHVVHSGGALVVLLVATVLAVYKPRGITPYGRRKQIEQRVKSLP
jgi:hypothetical protein